MIGRRLSAGFFFALFAAAFLWALRAAIAPTAAEGVAVPRRDPAAILAQARAWRRADELSATIARVLVEHGVGRGDIRFETVQLDETGFQGLTENFFPRTEIAVDIARDATKIADALEAAARRLEGSAATREVRADHERVGFLLDGTEVVAMELYALELPASEHVGPRVAIVIDDVGYSSEPVYRLMGASREITFAVLPYGPHARELAGEIHENGSEVMLHLPMQPEGEPGGFSKEGMLLSSMDAAQLRALVREDLEKVPHATGVNNHMGSVLTASPEAMRAVMDELAARRVFFLDSRTTSKTVAYRLAREKGVPAAERDVFLDDVAEEAAIREQLARLETIAQRHGNAIAIGHPYPETVEALLAWLPTLEDKGITLVPASQLTGVAGGRDARKGARRD